VREGMVTLRGLPSAGVGFEMLWIGDHDVRRAPLVRGISLLDRIHVQKFNQHVRGITGHFLHDAASHKDRDTRWHVHLPYTEHIPGGALRVTPHVAQHATGRSSAIDGRTTRHPGYALSQRKRKCVEEVFGWLKTVRLLRKARHRGLARVGWMFTFAAAVYNLVRMRTLAAVA
jgi:Transposase DDE domain